MYNYKIIDNKYIFSRDKYDIIFNLDNIKYEYCIEKLKNKIQNNYLKNEEYSKKLDENEFKYDIYMILNSIYAKIKNDIDNNKVLAYLYLKYSSELRK